MATATKKKTTIAPIQKSPDNISVHGARTHNLKNVTVAYNVPGKILGKAGLGSARLYLTGVNLATFTKYSGWDPEVNTDYRAGNINQGGDFYAAPQIKSIVVGLNIGF